MNYAKEVAHGHEQNRADFSQESDIDAMSSYPVEAGNQLSDSNALDLGIDVTCSQMAIDLANEVSELVKGFNEALVEERFEHVGFSGEDAEEVLSQLHSTINVKAEFAISWCNTDPHRTHLGWKWEPPSGRGVNLVD